MTGGTPFTKTDGDTVKINSTRVIESVVIGVLAAVISVGGTHFVTVPMIQNEVATLKSRVAELASDSRMANNAAANDRGDIIRLQAQMTNTQQQLAATQQQIADVARSTSDRLTIAERSLMRISDRPQR